MDIRENMYGLSSNVGYGTYTDASYWDDSALLR